MRAKSVLTSDTRLASLVDNEPEKSKVRHLPPKHRRQQTVSFSQSKKTEE